MSEVQITVEGEDSISREIREEAAKIIVHLEYNLLDRLTFPLRKSVQLLRQVFIANPNTPDVDEIIQKGIALLQKKALEKQKVAKQKAEILKEEKTESIEKLNKQKLAFIQLLKNFGALQESLKSEYPASDSI